MGRVDRDLGEVGQTVGVQPNPTLAPRTHRSRVLVRSEVVVNALLPSQRPGASSFESVAWEPSHPGISPSSPQATHSQQIDGVPRRRDSRL